MDNVETTKTSNSFDLDKETMRSWLDFISKINQAKDQEAEKIVGMFHDKIAKISLSGFFSKETFDENEKFFLTGFCPSFIKKISNENVTNNYLKSVLRNILQIFLDEFIKNFENPHLFATWESLVETFREEKLFNRSLIDCADKFLVNFLY